MTAYNLISELMELCEKNSKFLNLETTKIKLQSSALNLPEEIEISFKGHIDEHKNNKFEIILKPKK